MATPYGLLPGTLRTAHNGTIAITVVKYVGPQELHVTWDDTGERAVIAAKDLDFMPKKGNPPHGLNAGTIRTVGVGGPEVRVQAVPGLVRVAMVGTQDEFFIHHLGLGPIKE